MKLATIMAGAVLAFAGSAFAASDGAAQFGDCKLAGEAGSVSFKPVKEDTLVVGTVLPNPGWWIGSTPSDINAGFEYCLAAQIAHRAGVHHLEVHNMAWDQFISGAATGYDIAMAGVTITDKRRAILDFSTPYFSSNLGVATKADSGVTADNLRQKRIGVLQGNMGADWVVNTLKPEVQPSMYQSMADMFTALAANQVDVVITDTALALASVKASNGRMVVPAQFKLDQGYGIVMPKGTANQASVDKVVGDLKADGTLGKMTEDYLAPMFGGNPDTIPFWEIK